MHIPQLDSTTVDSIPTAPVAYADITVILDRSASMVSIQQGMVEAYNDYVRRMRETPGDSKWTMVQFDDHPSAIGAKEAFPKTVYSEKNEHSVPFLTLAPTPLQHLSVSGRSPLHWPETEATPPVLPDGAPVETYVPRGGTALVDAMCKTIDATQARLSGKDDYVKPIVMVITDGEENSSLHHTTAELRQRIAATQAKGWQYMYLGANQDSFAEAHRYGIDTGSLAKYSAGICAASGGLVPTAVGTNNFDYTCGGVRVGLSSGMMGLSAVISGSVARGVLTRV